MPSATRSPLRPTLCRFLAGFRPTPSAFFSQKTASRSPPLHLLRYRRLLQPPPLRRRSERTARPRLQGSARDRHAAHVGSDWLKARERATSPFYYYYYSSPPRFGWEGAVLCIGKGCGTFEKSREWGNVPITRRGFWHVRMRPKRVNPRFLFFASGERILCDLVGRKNLRNAGPRNKGFRPWASTSCKIRSLAGIHASRRPTPPQCALVFWRYLFVGT